MRSALTPTILAPPDIALIAELLSIRKTIVSQSSMATR